MQDTIFAPAFGNRPSQLVGRDSVMQDFMDGIKQPAGNRKRSILLLGQRGSGKTVLLWEFAELARQNGYVVANPTTAGDHLLQRVIEKIQDSGERLISGGNSKLEGGSIGALGFSVGLQFSREQEERSFHNKLSKLCAQLNTRGKGVLILIDEAQSNNAEIRQLVTAYQELIGEGADIALVMAGLPSAVSELLNDSVLTFLNRAHRITLDPLAISDVHAYFRQSFAKLHVNISNDLCKHAASATHGSPYLLQLIGHNIVARAQDDPLSDADIQQAIEDANEDFKIDVCKTTLKQLSDKDIEFLRAMAVDEKESKVADIAKRMGVSVDYAQKYRRRTIDAGVIRASRRGYVEFAITLLPEYLREEA